jgi:GrpB-like predicted nucleotidyltransferase (UPF0157 family)
MSHLVVLYDASWPERFEEEAERIRDTLSSVAVEIEHIGSTAVPGLAAKPTIDIAVGVRELDDVGRDETGAMEKLNYVYRGEAGVPGRHYFRKGHVYPRDFHVSIIQWRGQLWSDYLMLRDYLRERPEEAAAYVQAKRTAERAMGKSDPISYWEHKRAFVHDLLERARAV